jgi:hypothetical protein
MSERIVGGYEWHAANLPPMFKTWGDCINNALSHGYVLVRPEVHLPTWQERLAHPENVREVFVCIDGEFRPLTGVDGFVRRFGYPIFYRVYDPQIVVKAQASEPEKAVEPESDAAPAGEEALEFPMYVRLGSKHGSALRLVRVWDKGRRARYFRDAGAYEVVAVWAYKEGEPTQLIAAPASLQDPTMRHVSHYVMTPTTREAYLDDNGHYADDHAKGNDDETA